MSKLPWESDKKPNNNSNPPPKKIRWLPLIVAFIVAFVYSRFLISIYSAPTPAPEPEHITLADASIDNPFGETVECDLHFLYVNRAADSPAYAEKSYPSNSTAGQTSPTDESPATSKGRLHADAEYIVQLDFPDALLAELENGNHVFTIAASYDFEVDQNDALRAQVKLYNEATGNLYIANGSAYVSEDLCVKHSPGHGSVAIFNAPEFTNDHFAFSIYTSALPDAGPKATRDTDFDSLNVRCDITGVSKNEQNLAYE